MWKDIVYKVIFLALNIVFICSHVHDYSGCGPIELKNGKFNEREDRYECIDLNDHLFGNETLTCKEDGSWEGKMPFCASPIKSIKIWKDGHDKSKKFEQGLCVDPGSNGPWEIKQIGKSFSAVRIEFKVSSDRLRCPAVSLTVNNQFNQHTKVHKTNCDSEHIQFTYEFHDLKGNIRFYLNEDSWNEFSVCHISVYSKSDEKCPISSINLSNGYISPRNIHRLEYGEHGSFNCSHGYQLSGNPHFYCGLQDISKIMPECQRIKCRDEPMKIRNGLWEDWNQTTNYFIGDELHLDCKPGYKLNTTGDVKCLQNGEWSHSHAACLKWKFPLYLIITVVIAAIVLVLLFVGLFLVYRNRRLINAPGEETKQEHIYSEINYEEVKKKEPPPLPEQMANRKIERLESSIDINTDNRLYYGSMHSENDVDTSGNVTEDSTSRKTDNEMNVDNVLYNSD